MTGCVLTAIEWLLVALVRLRAVLLRRRRLPAAQAAALKRCRYCGCDDTHSCIEFIPCHWTTPGCCSWCGEAECEAEASPSWTPTARHLLS